MTMKAMLPAAFAALILVGGAALVSAHPIQDSEEAQQRAALQNAKITLSEAIVQRRKKSLAARSPTRRSNREWRG